MDLGNPLYFLRGEEAIRPRAVQIGSVKQPLAEQWVGKMRLVNGDSVRGPDQAAGKDKNAENSR